ncbi:MAG: glycine--tRNA ligase subunit beta [Alteromonadaceae bacterium]|nr:glycine--tRNA ligase subunit beta [Alteromonadaceae bacterium]
MIKDTLLVEIGTEELPPKALKKLGTSFLNEFKAQLDKNDLGYEDAVYFATPRRLAIQIKGLNDAQEDKQVEKKGPAYSAAFDDSGAPTKAALGWARGNGIDVSDAEIRETPKGKWLYLSVLQKGKNIDSLLESMLQSALQRLPIPKLMRWGNSTHQFIRPVHNICALYGNKVLDISLFGIKSDNRITGHRFHSPVYEELGHADNYEEFLEAKNVVASFEIRKQQIGSALKETADSLEASFVEDDELLEEVTALVEWPVVLAAEFEEKFLSVPKEALIYTMKDDQRYFPLLDNEGNLVSKFLFVSNIESQNPQMVISGNEKVVRPRLADAEFFFNTDKKMSSNKRLDSLKSIVFQKQLGTVYERVERIEKLAHFIASNTDANTQFTSDIARLSKSDLVSNMVMEFPAVQGVMGKYYAKHDGYDAVVCDGIEEHYKPRFAGDDLPSSLEAACVAIADKLDLLVGIFGIGQLPKGDKDPFALRRAAIGLIRILLANEVKMSLADLVQEAINNLADALTNKDVKQNVVDFVFSRFKTMNVDAGFDSRLVQSVLNTAPQSMLEADAKLTAIATFIKQNDISSIVELNKRVGNILKKSDNEIAETVDQSLFDNDFEKVLFEVSQRIQDELNRYLVSSDYLSSLKSLEAFAEPLTAFFDNVMVNADDPLVKGNRLALLNVVRKLFLTCSDISEI